MQLWAAKMPAGCFVYTSNVDGHFQKSGYPRDCVVECHGSIHHLQCTEDCRGQVWSAGKVSGLAIDPATCRARGDLPHCPDCGALARPNVLMFGDGRWQARRTEVQQGRFDDWLAQVGSRRLVVIELGAGTSIPSVRRIGESLLTQGAMLVRINPREAQGPRGTISIGSGALAAVKGIAAVMA
jgi:NAD-dependent SIR2 family protein deacetylase